MNSEEIWDMFCASYQGMYPRFSQFDSWYNLPQNNFPAAPSLQAEFKKYIRVALDDVVVRSRAEFDAMYTNRRYVPLTDPAEVQELD